MAVQPVEPSAAFALLDAHHLQRMQSELKRVLVLLMAGRSRAQIAHEMNASAGTVKRWVETATAEILTCLEGEHHNRGELRGFWVRCHLGCCLADEAATA